MTLDELDNMLDAMAKEAGSDPDLQPGLITVQTNDWANSLGGLRGTCFSLPDGIRHRGVRIVVGRAELTGVFTRVQVGKKGAPYRDLLPRVRQAYESLSLVH